MPLATFIEVTGRNPDGSVRRGVKINPVKPFVRGYWMIDPNNETVTLAAQGAAGDSATVRFNINSQGHFDWVYTMGVSTGAYSLEFYDAQSNRRLQNRPVNSLHIVGIATRPFRLPKDYFLDVGKSAREVSCVIRNLTGTQNLVRLVLYGRRFYHREMPEGMADEVIKSLAPKWNEYSFFLVPRETNMDGTVTAVGANARAVFMFDQDDNADFEVQKLMITSTGTFTFELRENDKRQVIATGAIDSTMGSGNSEFPFIFADTFLLERKKQLLLEVTDTSGNSNSIFATLAGKRMQYR